MPGLNLRVIGAGLPRTGTSSLKKALQYLLEGACYHMSEIPGHPFDLGAEWQRALDGKQPDWNRIFGGYVAAVDWPASLYWRELHELQPDALVILSTREDAGTWWRSMDELVLKYARLSSANGWNAGRDLGLLLERFSGTRHWDDRTALISAYHRHHEMVKSIVQPFRLLEWKPTDGWKPICTALGVPVPGFAFPWEDGRGASL